jgi:hypothetical protein
MRSELAGLVLVAVTVTASACGAATAAPVAVGTLVAQVDGGAAPGVSIARDDADVSLAWPAGGDAPTVDYDTDVLVIATATGYDGCPLGYQGTYVENSTVDLALTRSTANCLSTAVPRTFAVDVPARLLPSGGLSLQVLVNGDVAANSSDDGRPQPAPS